MREGSSGCGENSPWPAASSSTGAMVAVQGAETQRRSFRLFQAALCRCPPRCTDVVRPRSHCAMTNLNNEKPFCAALIIQKATLISHSGTFCSHPAAVTPRCVSVSHRRQHPSLSLLFLTSCLPPSTPPTLSSPLTQL